MKKTKKTIMTAALLSAAVTVQSQLAAPSAGNESEAAVLYGPPWVFHAKGDLNMDNKINIVVTFKSAKILNFFYKETLIFNPLLRNLQKF